MLKRYHYREKRPPAWWIRDCSKNQSPSTAAQAGRIGVCLQKLCVWLFCAAGLTLGTNGEIRCTRAQRDLDAVQSIVLDTAVLHAGDAAQEGHEW